MKYCCFSFDSICPISILYFGIPASKNNNNFFNPTRNFGLLSFGEEAEGDEEETNVYVKKNAGKAKSLHDNVDDPKLSKEPIRVPNVEKADSEEPLSDDCKEDKDMEKSSSKSYSDLVKKKLSKGSSSRSDKKIKEVVEESDSDDDQDVLMTREKEQSRKISEEK